jgi:hypothetical protein
MFVWQRRHASEALDGLVTLKLIGVYPGYVYGGLELSTTVTVSRL